MSPVPANLKLFPCCLSVTFLFLFQDSELFPGTESHKKKKKHSSDEYCSRGKTAVRQQERLADDGFEEKMLLNQCHQILWLALYGGKFLVLRQIGVIRNLVLMRFLLHEAAKDQGMTFSKSSIKVNCCQGRDLPCPFSLTSLFSKSCIPLSHFHSFFAYYIMSCNFICR